MRPSLSLIRLALVVGLTLAPAAVHAVEVRDGRILRFGDHAAVALRTTSVLSPRVRGSLERGMPATVHLSVDLWRVRPGWFDQLVHTEQSEIRVARDAWSDEFQLHREGGPLLVLLDLDEVERELTRPTRVRLVPVAAMMAGVQHYAIVHVEVKPLTVEDIEEVEAWLSGEAKRSGKPGPGSIARLPRYMVGILANLSGLGDETATYRSGAFTREDF